MEAMEAFEPLNYEEEFIRFSETVATNLEKFQRSCDDIKKIEYNDNSLMANSEKVNAALQSFLAALNHREKVAFELDQEEQYVRDIAKDIRDVSEQEVESSKKLAEMNEAAVKKKSQLAAKRTQTSSSRDLFEEKRGKISGELEKWKSTLGLELFVSTHGGIIFSFSNVLRDSPEKTFTCELEGKMYFMLKFCFIDNLYFQPIRLGKLGGMLSRIVLQLSMTLKKWSRY